MHLAMRLGIHTGLVVVGDMGGGPRREQLALGETPIIAARIQGLAMPDTVLISAATARLVQGFLTRQPLGAQDLKGLSEPLNSVPGLLRERDADTSRRGSDPRVDPTRGARRRRELAPGTPGTG